MQDFDRDLPTARTYELENNKVILQREDPYGFWFLRFERGQMPEKLKGAYTSANVAETELLAYFRDKDKTFKKV